MFGRGPPVDAVAAAAVFVTIATAAAIPNVSTTWQNVDGDLSWLTKRSSFGSRSAAGI